MGWLFAPEVEGAASLTEEGLCSPLKVNGNSLSQRCSNCAPSIPKAEVFKLFCSLSHKRLLKSHVSPDIFLS